MGDDDPFGLYDSTERTAVVRPRPGGAPVSRTAGRPPPGAGRALAWPSVSGQPKSLVKAAEPLLALAPCLQTPTPPRNVDELHDKVRGEIQRFMDTAGRSGASREDVENGSYCLAALIDDVILNTPWGARSGWPSKRLSAQLHQDVDAGRGFYQKLDELQHAPDRHQGVLELMYACLAMGFEGVYRVDPPRGRTLAQIKEDLYRLLSRFGSQVDRSLSPQWQGAGVGLAKVRSSVPPWTAGVAALALLALLYAGFSYRLSGYGDDVAKDLPSAEAVALARRVQAAPAPPPEPVIEQAKKVFLAAKQEAGLVEVEPRGSNVIVRILGEGLFASGSSRLQPDFLGTIRRVGLALEEITGPVSVIGHTDSVGSSSANMELSRKRAASVAHELGLSDQGRLRADGVGDTQPIAPNDTEDGRRRNRRIEIVIPR
ncbi:MAG: type IVB secretion system protein IcmH/DotU [Geminicoccaceae bacterium]